MEPSAKQFFELPSDAKRRVHLDLCRHALAVWEEHIRRRAFDMSYVERVCGTRQGVDLDLPSEAMHAVASREARPEIAERYLEPITALQDGDFELPEAVQLAYYAIYNLFEKYAAGAEVDDWLIVNQALSAHPAERWLELLTGSLAAAG